jgi:anti-sigma B factor antagonist
MSAGDYEVRWIGRQAAVAMPAEIDVANADEIHRALVSAASLGAPVLIVDMSGTTFCDSAGVHAIIAAYKQAAAVDTQLRLVAPAVMRILTLVGVDQLVPLYPTLQAALAGAPSAQTNMRDLGDEPGETTP